MCLHILKLFKKYYNFIHIFYLSCPCLQNVFLNIVFIKTYIKYFWKFPSLHLTFRKEALCGIFVWNVNVFPHFHGKLTASMTSSVWPTYLAETVHGRKGGLLPTVSGPCLLRPPWGQDCVEDAAHITAVQDADRAELEPGAGLWRSCPWCPQPHLLTDL